MQHGCRAKSHYSAALAVGKLSLVLTSDVRKRANIECLFHRENGLDAGLRAEAQTRRSKFLLFLYLPAYACVCAATS